MNIDHVISFIYIDRLKNFHKAARKLYITQPSLTSRIKALEKELGVLLFIRSHKTVELTKEGEVFLPYAHQIFNSYLKAKMSLQKNTSSITVGSIISVSTTILPSAVYHFQKNNSHLSIEIITAKTSTMIDKLLNQDCDIIITESFEHPDIITEPVFHDNISLIVQPSHPFTKLNRKVTLEEVSNEPLICFNPISNYWGNILSSFKSLNFTPNIIFNIDSVEAAKSAITKNIGISFLPELSLENDISSGYLSKVPIESGFDFEREISLSYLIDANEEIQRLSEFLLQTIKQQEI